MRAPSGVFYFDGSIAPAGSQPVTVATYEQALAASDQAAAKAKYDLLIAMGASDADARANSGYEGA